MVNPIRQAFQSARQRLANQQQQAQSQIQQQREQIQSQQQALSKQGQRLQSQAIVRNIPLIQRQQIKQQLSQAGLSLKEQLSGLSQAEQSLQQQVSSARQWLTPQQERRALEDFERSKSIQEKFGVERGVKQVEEQLGMSLRPDIRADIERQIARGVDVVEVPSGQIMSVAPIVSPQVSGVATLPTFGERFRGGVREITGISLPSLRQGGAFLVKGTEFEEPSDVSPFDVVELPLTETRRISQELVRPSVERGLEEIGFPGFQIASEEITPTSLQPVTFPERVRGEIRGRTGITFPSFRQAVGLEGRSRILTPEEAGLVAGVGTELGALFALPESVVVPGLISEGSRTALNPELEFQQRFLGGAEAALGVGIGSLRAFQFVTEPRVIFRQAPTEQVSRQLTDLIPVTLPSGETGYILRFRQAVTTPARFETRASRLQESLGRIPEPTQISPRTTFRSAEFPPEGILIDEAGNILSGGFATRREGATLTKAFSLKGGSEEFNLADLQRLTDVERQTLFRGVGGRTGGLIAVPDEAGVRFFTREVSPKQVFRIAGREGDFVVRFPQAGRATTRFTGTSAIREIPTGVEGAERFFRTASGDIETTFPVFRASRSRVSRTDGIMRVRQPRETPGEFILTGRGRRRPSLTQQRQEAAISTAESVQEAALKTLVKQARRSARIRAAVETPLELLPVIVGGAGRTAGAFAGTGLFERTETAPVFQITPQREREISPTTLGITPSQVSALSPALQTKVKQLASEILAAKTEQRQVNIAQFGFAQPQRQTPAQKQIESQRQALRILQSISLSQRLELTPPPATTTTTLTPPEKPPRGRIVPPPPLDEESGVLIRRALRKIRAGRGVDVIVSRGGKKKTLLKNVPRFRGLKAGLENLTKTFTSTLELRDSGKKPKARDIRAFTPKAAEFRPSRKDPLKIVEKKEFRLDSPEETKVFQAIRRRKGGFRGRK